MIDTDFQTFSIEFNDRDAFNKACEHTNILLPDDISYSEMTMNWREEWWRNQAMYELESIISTDYYTEGADF